MESKVLMRSGHKNSKDSERILLYHLVRLSDSIKKKKDEFNKLINNAFQKESYYAFVNDNNYVHFEQDGSIYLTNHPTCIFDIDIFDDEKYFNEIGMMIINKFKDTNYYEQSRNIELKLITHNSIQKILNRR